MCTLYPLCLLCETVELLVPSRNKCIRSETIRFGFRLKKAEKRVVMRDKEKVSEGVGMFCDVLFFI